MFIEVHGAKPEDMQEDDEGMFAMREVWPD